MLENSVNPDQLAPKKPADQDPHCLPCSKGIHYIKLNNATESIIIINSVALFNIL